METSRGHEFLKHRKSVQTVEESKNKIIDKILITLNDDKYMKEKKKRQKRIKIKTKTHWKKV